MECAGSKVADPYTPESNGLRLMQIEAGLKSFEPMLHYRSGNGAFVEYMHKRGFRISGYEPGKRPDVPLTMPSDRYHCVVAVDIFNFSAPSAELSQIAELLIPGGALFIEADFTDEIARATGIEAIEEAGFVYIQSASERVHYFYKGE